MNSQDDSRKSAASQHVPSKFEQKTRAAAPPVQEDFKQAHANDDRRTVAPAGAGDGSEQVRKTGVAPRPKPPPGVDHAGARRAHEDAMYRDEQAAKAKNARTKEAHKQASKEAFLRRKAAEKDKDQDKKQGWERG